MATDWTDVNTYLPLLGAYMGSQAGGDSKQTQTQDKTPWAAAQPYLLKQLSQNDALQNYYANNPFSAGQKAAYQGQADVLANNLANVGNFNQIANNFMGSNHGKMAAMPGLLSDVKAAPIDFAGLTAGTSGALANAGLLGKPVTSGGSPTVTGNPSQTNYGVDGTGLTGQVNQFINSSASTGNYDPSTGSYKATEPVRGDWSSLSSNLTDLGNWLKNNAKTAGTVAGLVTGGPGGAMVGNKLGGLFQPEKYNPGSLVDGQPNYSDFSGGGGLFTGGTDRTGFASNSYDGSTNACVQIGSYLPDGKTAGEIKVGDTMILADEKTLEEGTGVVSYSEKKLAKGYRIKTRNASLVCSDTAPIPTTEGLVKAPELDGKTVAVMVKGVAGWEPVTSVEHIGHIEVQHITVGDKCFWAGEKEGAYILHHNQKANNTISAADQDWLDYMKSIGM